MFFSIIATHDASWHIEQQRSSSTPVCHLLDICFWTDVIDLTVIVSHIRRVLKCVFTNGSVCVCPEMTPCSSEDIKIHLLTVIYILTSITFSHKRCNLLNFEFTCNTPVCVMHPWYDCRNCIPMCQAGDHCYACMETQLTGDSVPRYFVWKHPQNGNIVF